MLIDAIRTLHKVLDDIIIYYIRDFGEGPTVSWERNVKLKEGGIVKCALDAAATAPGIWVMLRLLRLYGRLFLAPSPPG